MKSTKVQKISQPKNRAYGFTNKQFAHRLHCFENPKPMLYTKYLFERFYNTG